MLVTPLPNRDASQAGAGLECIISNARNPVRDRDVGQAGADLNAETCDASNGVGH